MERPFRASACNASVDRRAALAIRAVRAAGIIDRRENLHANGRRWRDRALRRHARQQGRSTRRCLRPRRRAERAAGPGARRRRARGTSTTSSIASSAISLPSARCWRIHRPASRPRRHAPAVERRDIQRLEQWIDAAEAELPPLRRFVVPGGITRRRRPAPRAHRLPPCRAAHRLARARGRAGRDGHLRQPAVGSALRPRPPREPARQRSRSGVGVTVRRGVRDHAPPGVHALRELSGRSRTAARPRCGSTSRPCTPTLEWRTISRMKAMSPVALRHQRLDEWLDWLRACRERRRALPSAVRGAARCSTLGRRRRRPRSFLRSAPQFVRCDLPAVAVRGSRERVPAGYHRAPLRLVGGAAGLLPSLGQSRSAGWCCGLRAGRDSALDEASDAVCTALQLTNFWQDLAIDWRRGRLYVPAEEHEAAGGRRSDRSIAGSGRTAGRVALARCAERTRALFERGRRRCRRRSRPAPLGASRDVARRHAHPRSSRARRIRRVPPAAQRWAPSDVPPIAWRALRWRR